jgi:hypothetical protein
MLYPNGSVKLKNNTLIFMDENNEHLASIPHKGKYQYLINRMKKLILTGEDSYD